MTHFLSWLSSNVLSALGIFGAAVAFMVSTWQQVSQRRAEGDERQFQVFHNIVEKVVSPQPTDGLFYFDRQAAVIFELRHFPRYYEFTERLLTRLKKKWVAEATPTTEILLEEVDLA